MKVRSGTAILISSLMLLATSFGVVGCGGNEPDDTDKVEGREWQVISPDNSLRADLVLDNSGSLYYKITDGDTVVVTYSALGFELAEDNLNQMLTYVSENKKSVTGTYENISGRNAIVAYAYRELTLTLSGTSYYLDVTVRAYDDGYAFRYGIRSMENGTDTVTVQSECTEFAIPESSTTWIQAYKSNKPSAGEFFSYEEQYTRRKSENLAGRIVSMPMMYRVGDTETYSLITESELIGSGYYGSFLKEEEENEGKGILHTIHNPAGIADPDNVISVPFESPWRVGAVGSLDEVAGSEIVEKVYDDAEYWKPDNFDALSAEEQTTFDYDWVEPGVVAWNWLVYPKDQKNYELQRKYVDLAAEMGWKYTILDGGWDAGISAATIKDFVQYANNKGVKVLVWCNAFTLFGNGSSPQLLAQRLQLWKSWGIDGIKIDFFDGQENIGQLTHQGEDIETIKWYETIYQECAKLRMVVNCHGCNKPTGERRIYPNVINREAIFGNELWPSTGDITVNSMFVRQVVGPTDFTPMVQTKKGALTVGHEMALAILYESGAPSMADYSETYENEAIREFYSSIPASRDETLFLCGELDGYYCAAVRVGDDWFVAGINASGTSRTANFDCSFLSDGEYTALYYIDSNDDSTIIDKSSKTISNESAESVEMTANGGFVIQIKKK